LDISLKNKVIILSPMYNKKFEAVTDAGIYRAEIRSSQPTSIVRINIETETPSTNTMKVSFSIDNESKSIKHCDDLLSVNENVEQLSPSIVSPKEEIEQKENIPKTKFNIGDPIIACFSNNKITVYDVETGQKLGSVGSMVKPLRLGISPDNLNIVSCYQRSAVYSMKLTDIIANKIPSDILSESIINSSDYARTVTSFAISPNRDNLLIAIGYDDGMLRLVKPGNPTQSKNLDKQITHLAFSADGNLLITETDKICIWNVETLDFIKEFNISNILSRTVLLSGDNRFLYYLIDCGFFVIRNIDSNATTTFTGPHENLINSYDQRIFAAFSNNNIAIRNPAWLKNVPSQKKIHNVHFIPNYDLIIHTEDQIVRWDYTSEIKRVLINKKFSMIAASNN